MTTQAPYQTFVATAGPVLEPDLVSERFVELIPRDFAREHLVLSQGGVDGVERLVVAETTSPDVVFNVGVRLGRRIEQRIGNPEDIAQGYAPYRRQPVVRLAPDGRPIRGEGDATRTDFDETLFEAAVDAGHGRAWARETGPDAPQRWWGTQGRLRLPGRWSYTPKEHRGSKRRGWDSNPRYAPSR